MIHNIVTHEPPEALPPQSTHNLERKEGRKEGRRRKEIENRKQTFRIQSNCGVKHRVRIQGGRE